MGVDEEGRADCSQGVCLAGNEVRFDNAGLESCAVDNAGLDNAGNEVRFDNAGRFWQERDRQHSLQSVWCWLFFNNQRIM